MQINAYLIFNGQCEAAFKFYEEVLRGKIGVIMRRRGSPMEKETPVEALDTILHARLSVGSQVLMGGDAPPGRYQAPQGTWISIGVEDPAEAERIFAALAEGASIIMPIQETFWARRFAMLEDRFGTPWMINCEKQP